VCDDATEIGMRSLGTVVRQLRAAPGPGPRRRKPQYWKETYLIYQYRNRWYHLYWHPYKGCQFIGSSIIGAPRPERTFLSTDEGVHRMKRRSPIKGSNVVMPALSAESKLLGKCAQLVEFITATAYEDGTPRTPGYLWFNNRGHLFECTLFDPDSGGRISMVGKTIDDTLAAADTILRAAEAPWLPDRFLTEQLEKKSKKK